ncbi:MAG: hypothetical protein ACO1NQ_03035 [Flavobacteriales bacterium]
MLRGLDPRHPGRGQDIFNDTLKDRAMAYALILRAEANRYASTGAPDARDRVMVCTEWLMANSDLNGDGVAGYGLADPWDAFGDGTTNPAYQEYVITTAMCIEALQDRYALVDDTTGIRAMRQLVLACVQPFLSDRYDSPGGLLTYSRNPNDALHDVFNSSIHMAGQLQRIASWVPDTVERGRLTRKARSIMRVLEAHQLRGGSGAISWTYGLAPNSPPNDLLHASYIAEGIREYRAFGGATTLELEAVIAHFEAFARPPHWYENCVADWQEDPYATRLWSLGQLLYTLAREGRSATIVSTVWPQLCQYHMGQGRFRLKRGDDRVLIRHQAHVLLGASYMLYPRRSMEQGAARQ